MSTPFDPPKADVQTATTDFEDRVREEVVAARPYQLVVAAILFVFAGLTMLSALFNPCIGVFAIVSLWPIWLLFDSTRRIGADAPPEAIAMALDRQAGFWRAMGWTTLVIGGLYAVAALIMVLAI